MNVSEQRGIAAAKGKTNLGLIRRNIVYKKELIIPRYKTLVRHHLEYCICYNSGRSRVKHNIRVLFYMIIFKAARQHGLHHVLRGSVLVY